MMNEFIHRPKAYLSLVSNSSLGSTSTLHDAQMVKLWRVCLNGDLILLLALVSLLQCCAICQCNSCACLRLCVGMVLPCLEFLVEVFGSLLCNAGSLGVCS